MFCARIWTHCWLLSALNSIPAYHAPSWQNWQTKCSLKHNKYTTKAPWSDISYDKQLCQTHSDYTQLSLPDSVASVALTRRHGVTHACQVSSCSKEGQGRGNANYNPDCSSMRSDVCQISTVCSFLFKWSASLNSRKCSCTLLLNNSHNTLAVTFGPTTPHLTE